MGRGLLVGGVVNVFLGTQEFDENFALKTASPWVLVAVLTGFCVVATLLMEFGIGQKHEHIQLPDDDDVHDAEERDGVRRAKSSMDDGVDAGVDSAATLLASSSRGGDGGVGGWSRKPGSSFWRNWSRTVSLSFLFLTMVKLVAMVVGLLVALTIG